MKEKVYLQITSGRGPTECCRVVALVLERIVRQAQASGLKVEMIEREVGPVNRTLLSATIALSDWEQEGAQDITLDCGKFILDEPKFSGWPVSGTLSAVSIPANKGFSKTERTKTWENVTLKEIGKNIADRAGIALAWDVSGSSFSISSVEQSKENDCTFFTNLCNDYGLQVKVYSHKLVVYDREAYKKKAVVDTVDASEFASWDGGPSMSEVYTGGEYTYTNPQTSKKIVAKVGGGDKILKKSGKADSAADAERKIKALVSNANHGHREVDFHAVHPDQRSGCLKWKILPRQRIEQSRWERRQHGICRGFHGRVKESSEWTATKFVSGKSPR